MGIYFLAPQYIILILRKQNFKAMGLELARGKSELVMTHQQTR